MLFFYKSLDTARARECLQRGRSFVAWLLLLQLLLLLLRRRRREGGTSRHVDHA